MTPSRCDATPRPRDPSSTASPRSQRFVTLLGDHGPVEGAIYRNNIHYRSKMFCKFDLLFVSANVYALLVVCMPCMLYNHVLVFL